MFKQWSEMLQLYKSSRPKYWRAICSNPFALHLLPAWAAVLLGGLIPLAADSVYGHPWGSFALMACTGLYTWALFLAREYFAGQHFFDHYQRHAIADQPFLQRDSYLHYAHFLDALKRTGTDVDQIARMVEFGKISGHPYKPLNLMQNTLFVWLMTFLAALAVEKTKLTRLWQFQNGDLAMVLALLALLLFVMLLMMVSEYRQHKGRLVRYLEWACHDLKPG
ncbi:hypothetical protein D3C77_25880 [compost metagenome]|uniref:hypothetical protein n=1 Tax=Pseudomonas TaxID=286 RepID=UPI000414C52C|nr:MULTISPECIES: hypothetical protein [Pseudomonas]MCW2268069.1 hypothetical protein [Pseudomonas sp. JUb96]